MLASHFIPGIAEMMKKTMMVMKMMMVNMRPLPVTPERDEAAKKTKMWTIGDNE